MGGRPGKPDTTAALPLPAKWCCQHRQPPAGNPVNRSFRYAKGLIPCRRQLPSNVWITALRSPASGCRRGRVLNGAGPTRCCAEACIPNGNMTAGPTPSARGAAGQGGGLPRPSRRVAGSPHRNSCSRARRLARRRGPARHTTRPVQVDRRIARWCRGGAGCESRFASADSIGGRAGRIRSVSVVFLLHDLAHPGLRRHLLVPRA